MRKVYTAVIYQDLVSLFEYKRYMLMKPAYGKECIKDTKDQVVMEYKYSNMGGYHDEYEVVYTFHFVESMQDAHNLAGFHFQNYWFCAGQYDGYVLNYLQSRIRG